MSSGTVIARGGLQLRKSPKTGTVLKTLRRNSSLEILEKETWLRVRTRDGEEGYVLADFVETAAADLFPGPVQPRPPPQVPPEGAPAPSGNGGAAAAAAVCDIRIYRNTRFIGGELRADVEFFPSLDALNGFATECGVEIFVTSSTREPGRTVSGAIVKPASRSNHLVGHAIDMNLKSAGGLFNSQALTRANSPNLPAEIHRFIDKVRAHPPLRWGGDFSQEDPVHIDDNLNGRDPARWDSKLASRV